MDKGNIGKGYTHVYTGNGKGKTTAAVGLAVRAAGADLKVFFLQIMKNFPYSELKSLAALQTNIRIEKTGDDTFVLEKRFPDENEKSAVKEKIEEVKSFMIKKKYDVFVLDEICVAAYFKLVDTSDIIDFIDQKPYGVELILTGRYCPEEVISRADLVTEMREVKHYYQQGILSRKGIDS
jgi:cob(I)alamin adenosyltransferase